MTTKIMKYTLEEFNTITFNGFKFDFPQDTLQIISELSLEVGSPNYVKTPVFQKRVNPMKVENFVKDKEINMLNKKKRGNKTMEVLNDGDWESLRTFQTTQIEKKVGFDAQIDLIRSYLNKLTDKNYDDIKNKIIDVIENINNLKLINSDKNESNYNEKDNEILKLGTIIFEIASTNRFYSKIYADLYSELINKYDIMKGVFEENLSNYITLFDNIEYVEPNVDYNKFCKINKDNERRKSLSAFFVNLMKNNIIPKDKIIALLHNLLNQLYRNINIDNKKCEVDELTENIAILFRKDLINNTNVTYELIDNMTINELIEKLAYSKSKNHLSLTNKSIFKFMDLIDM